MTFSGVCTALRRSAGALSRADLHVVAGARMWPVYVEAVLSSLWSIVLVGGILIWLAAYSVGVYDFGTDPIPNFWGMVIAVLCVAQIFAGLWLDGRYDRRVRLYALWAPLYPLVYWLLSASAALRATLPGLLRRRGAGPIHPLALATAF